MALCPASTATGAVTHHSGQFDQRAGRARDPVSLVDSMVPTEVGRPTGLQKRKNHKTRSSKKTDVKTSIYANSVNLMNLQLLL